MKEHPRAIAARWRAEQSGQSASTDLGDPEDRAQRGGAAAAQTELERAAVIETAIQQAIRRGEFDDLPGSGKPLPGLGGAHDPDWWIRQKIESEQLRGLGPPALALRVEDAQLDDRLDALGSEQAVRDAIEDFDRRVVEARRQLQGGPPVVTPLRDVEREVAAWHDRRARRRAHDAEAADARERPKRRRPRWWRRGRASGTD